MYGNHAMITVEPLRKGQPEQRTPLYRGRLFLPHTNTSLYDLISELRTPPYRGHFSGPNGVRYREGPLLHGAKGQVAFAPETQLKCNHFHTAQVDGLHSIWTNTKVINNSPHTVNLEIFV